MSEAAAMFVTALCPQCRETKPVGDFAGSYCRVCKTTYDRNRLRAIRAGTWVPLKPGTYTRCAPVLTPSEAAPAPTTYPTPPPGADTDLRNAIVDYFRAYGFTRLRTATEALIIDLSKAERIELAREGWIA